MLDRAAGMGFTDVLLASPFDGPSPVLPGDFNRLHPRFGSSDTPTALFDRLAGLCAARGLRLLLDVPLAAVADDGAAAASRPELFHRPDPAHALDPRTYDPNGNVAWARFDDQSDMLAPWWAETLSEWISAGVAGFRFLGLEHVPATALAAILAGARGAGDVAALGWTVGLTAERQAALVGSGLDYVFSSFPHWDFRADWLWTEYARLRRVACVVIPVALPLAAGVRPLRHEAAARRALGFAAALGDGWMVPQDFATDARRELLRAAASTSSASGLPRTLHNGGVTLALLRAPAGEAPADSATLVLANTDLAHPHAIPLAGVLGRFATIELDAAQSVTLAPAEVRSISLHVAPALVLPRPELAETAAAAAQGPRVAIENVTPAVEGGSFPAKRIVGDLVRVQADVIADGHDKVGVALLWRPLGGAWSQVRMSPLGNDRWQGDFPLNHVGRHEFTVEAWRDAYASFRDELAKKNAAGIDVRLEAMEGEHLVRAAIRTADARFLAPLEALAARLHASALPEQIHALLSPEIADLMAAADIRPRAVRPAHPFPVDSDRPEARFASWYEIFPRSMSDDPNRHGTFADVVRHLPRIRDMGFDVLYFPPIHPIGRVNRKGRNNALRAEPGDVGSPYAIGAAEGGHDAVHPDLGTLADFQHLVREAYRHGLEIAIDFAIQCSPDHPWLKQHHDWFAWRPDGSMKYAENPPKKYEDIVNVDFYAPAAIPDLWVALCEVVLFWAAQGVRIFRVDNPHTKPLPFWEWMIAEVRAKYPDALFLAEAFTRPKVMNRLGKIGFSQSYTYFTWRNTRAELTDYLTELSEPPVSDFFRPNFFVNTPDINPVPLQTAGREGFIARATLAATLSGLWGVYCGFELSDATPLPGREEYLDSEKYQIRKWDWNRPGNIVAEITRLNALRRANPALQSQTGIAFLPADNAQVIVYEKATPDRSNVVYVAVNLAPQTTQSAAIEIPLWKFGLSDHSDIDMDDLLLDRPFVWRGKWQRVTLDAATPCAIWRARPKG